MNLIEKLGGYEKAKGMRDINIQEFDGDASGVTIHYMGNSFLQEDLISALLQHRRENNIFEVGDLVVYVDDFMHDEINKVSNVNDRCWMNNDDAVCVFEMIRHATTEEIKAGRRL